MDIIKTEIDGVVILEPTVYPDIRGHFFESFSYGEFTEKVCNTLFVQDNESRSRYGVIRGLHYQLPFYAQSKLVRVVKGAILDVAVDIRRGSPTFGKYVAVELSSDNRQQLFIPRGFAHGYSVLSKEAVVHYKCDNYYAPSSERSIAWDDPELNIDWRVPKSRVVLSEKDEAACLFVDAELFDYKDNLY